MINVSTIKIPYEKLLARLGYLKAKTKLDAKTEILIKENLALAQKLISPKAVIAFSKIHITEDIISLSGKFKITGKDIAKLLDGCFKAYGIAVTIGKALEQKRNFFIENKETFNALVLDSAGSVAAEEAITLANSQIKDFETSAGNALTKRYSPGYGDWQLSSQKDFLNWLGAQKIGISLTQHYLMTPEKSVSAIIGVKTYLS
ncbi:vitamin B12 dependent-methionine synthase activation domain-containing protein [Endomicrobium proavitum]|uniref:Putative cobalamin-dependent methionine synthase n=1 Tax=Endomicrobium proavitum TaxID=1408281 RepID=A0A0G3WLQ3_9BACT|nr:vitamin B12 dependent-methionine synthase activation domain-containing protein [Endomicrobium proavitum]AKL98429.1 putative cobalamin-dependent methionine synthase [Endomicrobium proavitum]